MRSRSLCSGELLGVIAVAVGVVLLSVCTVQAGTEPVKAGVPGLIRGPAQGAPVQVTPQCGAVLHNFPRVITFGWNAVPGANGYQVEVDCFDCRQVGHWDSEVGPPQFVATSGPTTASFTFSGDNKGRWRVRGTETASAPGMSAIQAGPWSPWCEFTFKTGGTLGPPPGGPGQNCLINLASLSKTSGYPGDTFEMVGTWGATQGTKIPCINKGGETHLQVVTWTATKLTVKIPLGLEPGMYKVGVYCEELQQGVSTYSSGWLDFEILKQQVLPDITSKKGIVIGGAVGGAGGKSVAWGGSVVLTETEALHGSPNSECAFNLSYDMENLQAVPTGPAKFLNRIKADAKIVSIQSALSMAGNEVRQIDTQAYLPIGPHTLSLWLDDDHNVAEMPPGGESNNVFRITYNLQGKCYEAYNPKK
ncbi:MAG: hypothetical protein ABR961_00890 [Thermoanaerobaculaceae bacterium]